jgi:DNA invertase Pin-like site-specific DNA recombinase
MSLPGSEQQKREIRKPPPFKARKNVKLREGVPASGSMNIVRPVRTIDATALSQALVYMGENEPRPYSTDTDGEMPRFTAAMRVSTDKQADKYHTSQQWTEISFYLKTQHPDGYVIVRRIDETRSGASSRLEELFSLIDTASRTGASLIVSKTDRLHRSQENEVRINAYLQEKKVSLVYADGLPAMMRPFLSFMSNMERDMIRGRVQSKMNSRRADGFYSYLQVDRGAFTGKSNRKGVHTRRVKSQRRKNGIKDLVITLHRAGMSYRKIVKAMETSVPPVTFSIVRSVISDFKQNIPPVPINADLDIEKHYAKEISAYNKKYSAESNDTSRWFRLVRMGYSLYRNPGARQSIGAGLPDQIPGKMRADAEHAFVEWVASIFPTLKDGGDVFMADRLTRDLVLRSAGGAADVEEFMPKDLQLI